MRIISESTLATDSLIAPAATNQTIVPSSSSSSSPNSDPGMPATFHPHNNHNNRPTQQPPVIQQPPQQPNPTGVAIAAGKYFENAQISRSGIVNKSFLLFSLPPSKSFSNKGYIPYASEYYTTDQGYFMPQELCAAYEFRCKYLKIEIKFVCYSLIFRNSY